MPKKRDSKATEKTLAYFVSRDGKPTSIKQASKALKVPTSRLHTRVSDLTKNGKLVRIDRGVYAAGLPKAEVKLVDSNQELLNSLLKEREHLDAHIERVRGVMVLHETRKAGKK